MHQWLQTIRKLSGTNGDKMKREKSVQNVDTSTVVTICPRLSPFSPYSYIYYIIFPFYFLYKGVENGDKIQTITHYCTDKARYGNAFDHVKITNMTGTNGDKTVNFCYIKHPRTHAHQGFDPFVPVMFDFVPICPHLSPISSKNAKNRVKNSTKTVDIPAFQGRGQNDYVK